MRRLLLDTHTLLWFYLNDSSLSATARNVIEDPDNERFISIVTFWEISLLTLKGRFEWPSPFVQECERMLNGCHAELLQIDLTHLANTIALADEHKDPFDRLLVSQAFIENLELVTCDIKLRGYGIPIIW